jgi:CRISPR-associated protein Cas1
MKRNLQEIPKFSDRWSFLYFERGHIEKDYKSIIYTYKNKIVPVPVEAIALIMLGPGTTISHDAVNKIVESRTTLMWTGERGVRYYASADSATYSSRNLLRQAEFFFTESEKMRIIREMYQFRFPKPLDVNTTIQQIRGLIE